MDLLRHFKRVRDFDGSLQKISNNDSFEKQEDNLAFMEFFDDEKREGIKEQKKKCRGD